MTNIEVGDKVKINVNKVFSELEEKYFPITRKILIDNPDKVYTVLEGYNGRFIIDLDDINAISTFKEEDLIKVEEVFKVGDKVKVNLDNVKVATIGKDTYDVIKGNPDVEITVIEVMKDKMYPIKTNVRTAFGNPFLNDVFKENELILVDRTQETTSKVEIKEDLQVKINHEALAERIHELSLEFVGHLKLYPNHVYTVIKTQKDCDYFAVGTVHGLRVVYGYLYEDEVIVIDGEKL